MEQQHKKVYVSVNLDVDESGRVRPRLIRWEDGQIYEIDRLKQRCPAASTKAGGCGMRYTIVIHGQETYLFNEDDRWFVEAKQKC